MAPRGWDVHGVVIHRDASDDESEAQGVTISNQPSVLRRTMGRLFFCCIDAVTGLQRLGNIWLTERCDRADDPGLEEGATPERG